MPGTWSVSHTFSNGETLTHTLLNGIETNVRTNFVPAGMDDASEDVSAMRATSDPYPGDSESLATSLEEEIQQLRYMIKEITGKDQWYKSPKDTLEALTPEDQLESVPPVGSFIPYLLSTAPSGWLLVDGKTIGDASSGATARANADQETLFSYLWADYDNTILIIQDSSGSPTTRGASAAADFAAHKRLPLPNLCGRTLVGVGQGNTAEGGGTGTNRTLGATGGAETHAQQPGEVGAHSHSVTDPGHVHAISDHYINVNGGTAGTASTQAGAARESYNTRSAATGISIAATASPTGMNIMDPFWSVNFIVRY